MDWRTFQSIVSTCSGRWSADAISSLRTAAFRVDAAHGLRTPRFRGPNNLFQRQEHGIALLNIDRPALVGRGECIRVLCKCRTDWIRCRNAPASIAPSGGTQAVVGTNPWSLRYRALLGS